MAGLGLSIKKDLEKFLPKKVAQKVANAPQAKIAQQIIDKTPQGKIVSKVADNHPINTVLNKPDNSVPKGVLDRYGNPVPAITPTDPTNQPKPEPQASDIITVDPAPVTNPTNNKTVYWILGSVAGAGVIGTAAYFIFRGKKKSRKRRK